jgi:hypothetical protein
VVSSTPRPHFTPGKDPIPILQAAGWAPGPVWTGGKSRRHRDSIRDRPARSQSLYQLSYPAHYRITVPYKFHILNLSKAHLSLYILWAGWSGIESRWGQDFPPVQTGPGAHPASCTMGTGFFPGAKCGRGMLLTTHPLLVPWSWKSSAIPLPTLWATLGL